MLHISKSFLPLVVFGLLGYLEPVLLALASLVLGKALVKKNGLLIFQFGVLYLYLC